MRLDCPCCNITSHYIASQYNLDSINLSRPLTPSSPLVDARLGAILDGGLGLSIRLPSLHLEEHFVDRVIEPQ